MGKGARRQPQRLAGKLRDVRLALGRLAQPPAAPEVEGVTLLDGPQLFPDRQREVH